ncbi:DUF2911 domain-containing protein [Xanthomarina sp. F1114]|uniref:DUF2911 domain-containing protein n=1 Tax=Xanthomarina sp. F1114 TaxID=2996019 RepID=UPI00225E20EC|nr:DUF2911 domain-containing protein [Xanthomarina sp. F1114]MCX7548676.1 DUF2911 domain-containing protein [Xanthomarina sp. F1114]
MKKSTLFSVLTFACVLLFSTTISAQNFSGLDKSPMDAASFPSSYKVSDKQVKVIYSRPQLKGRDVKKLAPNGKVWRTGANEAVEITFYQDKMFGDKQVKAGTYSMFTIPGEKEWTVILNSDINVWGAYSYNETNDVVRVMAETSEGKKSLEAFSITFDDDGTMHLGWGTLRVAVPIK